jgi:hypothetical protein
MLKKKRVVVLENEVEARLLESVLTERSIPHVIVSYHDSAYDGLYQLQKGWGYVEAPERYGNLIKSIHRDLLSKT